tara:strand:+ start:291 stop:896 length:606 start_codon:yes stop_codon:yes gene_type:complete
MTIRKKKIILLQILLFIATTFVLFITYFGLNKKSSEKIFSEKTKKEISKKIVDEFDESNVFYDIIYSGLDLSGNRYVIKAGEASNTNKDDGFVNLKKVNAVFYFKNNKNLFISSDVGLYNNKTLDMKFQKNVKAEYMGSILLAEKAEYLNSKNFIEITDNVKINDKKGSLIAEKLIFDIEKNKLNITSSENKKIKANLNYK